MPGEDNLYEVLQNILGSNADLKRDLHEDNVKRAVHHYVVQRLEQLLLESTLPAEIVALYRTFGIVLSETDADVNKVNDAVVFALSEMAKSLKEQM